MCQWVKDYFSISLVSDLKYLALCWSLWSTWLWFLFKVISTIYLCFSTWSHVVGTKSFDVEFFFLPVSIPAFFIKHQVSISVWVCGCFPLINMLVFILIKCYLCYYSFVVQFEIRDGSTSSSLANLFFVSFLFDFYTCVA